MISFFGVWNCKISSFGLWRSTRVMDEIFVVGKILFYVFSPFLETSKQNNLGYKAGIKNWIVISWYFCAKKRFLKSLSKYQSKQSSRKSYNLKFISLYNDTSYIYVYQKRCILHLCIS